MDLIPTTQPDGPWYRSVFRVGSTAGGPRG